MLKSCFYFVLNLFFIFMIDLENDCVILLYIVIM